MRKKHSYFPFHSHSQRKQLSCPIFHKKRICEKNNCFHLSHFRLRKFRIIGKVFFGFFFFSPTRIVLEIKFLQNKITTINNAESDPDGRNNFPYHMRTNLRLLYDLLSAGMLPFSSRSKYSSEYPLYGILLLLRLW